MVRGTICSPSWLLRQTLLSSEAGVLFEAWERAGRTADLSDHDLQASRD